MAQRLFLQYQSTVGLVDRLVMRGLASRKPSEEDGRQVIVQLTRRGENVLKRLSLTHHAELEERTPVLQAIIRRLKTLKKMKTERVSQTLHGAHSTGELGDFTATAACFHFRYLRF